MNLRKQERIRTTKPICKTADDGYDCSGYRILGSLETGGACMQTQQIQEKLALRISQRMAEFPAAEYRKTTLFGEKLDKQLKQIRQKYKQVTFHGVHTAAEEWLYDNYYMIEREAKTVLQNLPNLRLPADVEGLPQVYILCQEAIMDETFTFTTSSVLELLELLESNRYIRSMELDALQDLMKAAAVSGIESALYDGFAEEKSSGLIGRCILLLNEIGNLDMEAIMRAKNPLERILKEDPSGIYSRMNEATRQVYRHRICRIAVKSGIDEMTLAEQYVAQGKQGTDEKSRHVGTYIYADYQRLIQSHTNRKWYIPLQWLVPAVLSCVLSGLAGNPLWAFILYFPLWEIIKPLIEYISVYGAESEYAPRLEFHGEVPAEGRTLVVISTLLPSAKGVPELCKKLEKLYHTNGRGEIAFLVLADLKQAKMPVLPEDAAQIRTCANGIRALNQKYGDRFMLLVRKRQYSRTGRVYTGADRKRGAILELVRMIRGQQTAYAEFIGDMAFLQGVKYLLALDYDTQALMDTACSLVSIALHPLNQPQIDPERKIVTAGYGIIAPKMVTDLSVSLSTPFAKVMCGTGGVSAYDTACLDIYQDLYGESIFTGKGLIDVDVFAALMNNRFPEETILSHDILEGSFLRTRFVSDLEFVDGFPLHATPFFKRLHRWIRGDFQNLPYLFPRIPSGGQTGGKEKNPLNAVSRFKLFDNLRRSFNPLFSFLLLVLAFFLPPKTSILAALIGGWSVVSPYLFGLLRTVVNSGIFAFSRKYYSNVMPQAFLLLSQALYQMILLPKFALNALDAALRAVYRRFISHKNMLEWTTAAQAESAVNHLGSILRFYWFPEVAGIFFLSSSYGYMRLFGLFFILALPLVLYSGKRYRKQAEDITLMQKDELLSMTAAMWNFYRDYAGASDRFLPPDNMQEAPVYRVAHRTSPTNIGLFLLSALTARDFDLIDSTELFTRIQDTIASVESLEKWKGNLYNWYDTKTLAVLHPAYISTVDSGNFVCCLVALKQGLKEYRGEEPRLSGLIERIERLIEETDLTPLYDKNKRLFCLGYDAETGKLSRSHYDMLMSEARMTSYFAIAKRMVPKKHWSALGRMPAKCNAFTGAISWTGTMFEYFMPELLLHCIEGSMGYESLRFCLYCQKQQAASMGVPFGISESGFYAFDSALNYQYKAHGVQKNALKRGMNRELVVAPYATFLTLPYNFQSGYRNLMRLKEIGAVGKYGYYEAVDYTASRIGSSPFALVKSYMAHHVGMSMVAVNNALHHGIMQKRFLSDPDMNSAKELLQEKILEGTDLFEDYYRKETPVHNSRESSEEQLFEKMNPQQPRVKLLFNGEITSVLTDTGSSFSVYQGKDMTRRPQDLLRRPNGVFGMIWVYGRIIPFTAAPDYASDVQHTVSFGANSISYQAEAGEIQAGEQVLLHPTLPCEQRQFVVRNNSTHRKEVEYLFYLEPSLSNTEDDAAHPAFSKLFVHIRYDAVLNILVAGRRQRRDEKTIWMAVGFLEDIPFVYETNREKVLECPDGIASLSHAFQKPCTGGEGLPDPCIAIRIRTGIPPRSQQRYTLILSAGNTEEQAMENILKMRAGDPLEAKKAAHSLLPHDSIEGRLSFLLLPHILFPKAGPLQRASASQNQMDIRGLWPFGISGDLPIVLLEITEEKDLERAADYLRCQNKLRLAGIQYDLVFLYAEGGEYGSPLQNHIRRIAVEENTENRIGHKGGLYLLDKLQCTESVLTLLRAAACYIAPLNLQPTAQAKAMTPYKPMEIHRTEAIQQQYTADYQTKAGMFADGKFVVHAQPRLPWSHVLANPVFGTLVSDRSLGYTWAVNSREMKLTPWYNDTMTDNRGEMLLLKTDQGCYDLLNGAQAVFTPERAEYHAKAAGIECHIHIWIPAKGTVKYLEVELMNPGETVRSIELAYYLEPVLDVNRSSAQQISGKAEEDILFLKNPFCQTMPAYAGLHAQGGEVRFCGERGLFLSGKWPEKPPAPMQDICAAAVVKKELPPKRKEKIRFELAFAENETAVRKLLKQTPALTALSQNRIQIKTPDAALDAMFNTWLPWQTLGARLYGRTGFFQCGGAYGFRDQLQDTCASLLLRPETAKRQIFRACAAQFEEGDVLHWWHALPHAAGGKKGVRTRYSDDLLWLPYTVCEYLDKTGDWSILDTKIRYLSAPELLPEEHDRYLEAQYTQNKESVYQHCIRALERGYRLGEHGLPLMGSGDWNDGYNRVGEKGKGESVWLAQFLALVSGRFADISERVGDAETAQKLRQRREELLAAVDRTAWDGNWYLRAFFDNGEKMGSADHAECQIDSLPQSFSVLADMPDKSRITSALTAAYERLFDPEHQIIRLFTPAFQDSPQEPGYVKSYPAGVRENGGQYTHAAVWLAMAFLKTGDYERGYMLIRALNPALRYAEEELGQAYQLEPYYMAGDIYTNPKAYGRGGWSIYTGAAGWYYRAILEYLLGVRIQDGTISIHPAVPKEWEDFSVDLLYQKTQIQITAHRAQTGEKSGMYEQGIRCDSIALDQKEHAVIVIF